MAKATGRRIFANGYPSSSLLGVSTPFEVFGGISSRTLISVASVDCDARRRRPLGELTGCAHTEQEVGAHLGVDASERRI